ncbi:phenylacetic acid degradation protein [Maritimibacter sp. 55A14]|uniref:PaaI family thioesterase n=1 Tax=Maritimibacter sp. 55A14 TaxID=2174844 RepID=UPI000D60F3A0|nr:PaaI family thioesterase [Maritimibacter sp. 55A14]PWE31973.1 phenylacetic acid degradation protein [Maritimibacter sp. 55A14]
MANLPRNPNFEKVMRESFARQAMMATLGAEMAEARHGFCRITAPILPGATQQHGFAHAGLTFAIGDSAAGYAALSVMEPGMEVLTSEMKIHLLAPARGRLLIAEGHVVKPGRRLVVVRADVSAETPDGAVAVATLLGTMIPVPAA